MSFLKIKISRRCRKRNLLQLLLWYLFLCFLVPAPAYAVLDFPDPYPVPFALGNLASYPEYLFFNPSSQPSRHLITGGSRLFQMPEVQPF
jgi:hypothetical protein